YRTGNTNAWARVFNQLARAALVYHVFCGSGFTREKGGYSRKNESKAAGKESGSQNERRACGKSQNCQKRAK
ncbi:MAG: hypothetical protein RRY03_06480, partial [Oscillospiraceae bacterium]